MTDNPCAICGEPASECWCHVDAVDYRYDEQDAADEQQQIELDERRATDV